MKNEKNQFTTLFISNVAFAQDIQGDFVPLKNPLSQSTSLPLLLKHREKFTLEYLVFYFLLTIKLIASVVLRPRLAKGQST